MSLLRKRKQREVQAYTESLVRDVPHLHASRTASWKTFHASKKRVSSLTRRMIALFSLISLMFVIILTVIMTLMWNSQVRAYNEANMETIAHNMSDTLSLTYRESHSWSSSTVMITRSLSKQLEGIDICVLDDQNHVVYNDFDPPEDAFAQASSSDKIVQKADITLDGQTVGHLVLQRTTPNTFSSQGAALFWQDTLYTFWVLVGVVTIFAIIIGFFTNRWVVRPIRKISAAAASVRNGDYSTRTGLAGAHDIAKLGATFDAMTATFERTLSAEHRLTSDVAHELRTPLMAILVNVEGMQDGVLPADDEHLNLVANEVKRLSRLVDALLALSRLENNTQALAMEDVSMGPLVRELVAAQKPLFKSEGLELMYQQNASDTQLMVQLDKDMFARAISNVLSNALRYTNEGGRVSVTLARKGTDVTIAIADTGIGISPEDVEQVFSRFWRSDASRARASGGLGIGLSLTKEIVDKHQGYIDVESELGVGTVFTLHIPAIHTPQSSGRLFTIDMLDTN